MITATGSCHNPLSCPSTMSSDSSNQPSNSPSPHRPAPRRLPAPPLQSKRISRPLPKIPRVLACKQCTTCITSQNFILPQSAVSINNSSLTSISSSFALDPSGFTILQRFLGESVFVHRNVSFFLSLSLSCYLTFRQAKRRPGEGRRSTYGYRSSYYAGNNVFHVLFLSGLEDRSRP